MMDGFLLPSFTASEARQSEGVAWFSILSYSLFSTSVDGIIFDSSLAHWPYI